MVAPLVHRSTAGAVVAVTIPLVLAATFLAMWYWKIGLHKVSLGSLIIALGLLVDDAIIAVEMMVRKLEEGYDKLRAATFAYEITAMPMLTGTLVTVAGFLPVGFALDRNGRMVSPTAKAAACPLSAMAWKLSRRAAPSRPANAADSFWGSSDSIAITR